MSFIRMSLSVEFLSSRYFAISSDKCPVSGQRRESELWIFQAPSPVNTLNTGGSCYAKKGEQRTLLVLGKDPAIIRENLKKRF